MATFPTVVTAAGMQPRDIEEIRATLLAEVAATNPGYTANLPGILIEDISGTDTLAIAQIDSARVETVNSLTPLGANSFLLLQLGQMLGIPIGVASNTSVFVVFNGPPGFVIGKGFLVTDGVFQYAVSSGGICGADGNTLPLFAAATQAGTWTVSPDTVNALVTSVPSSIALTVNNPQAGIPGSDVDLSEASYRARVLRGNLAASQGMVRYLRTLLSKVPGVQTRLIAARANPTAVGTWEIIVGGGDPYQVAYAIYQALFDISSIVGSSLTIAGITQGLPTTVTTGLDTHLVVGSTIHINGVVSGNLIDYNGDYVVMSLPTHKSLVLGKPYPLVSISAATWAANIVEFTTTTPHAITPGSRFAVAGMLPGGYNFNNYLALTGTTGVTLRAAQPVDPGAATDFGIVQPGNALFDSTALTAYVSGGVITPNPRNLTVSIQDYPDTYAFPIVIPPQQETTITITWASISPNFVNPATVAQAVAPAIADYVNKIVVGDPMSLIDLQKTFDDAVEDILMTSLISTLTFSVALNGVAATPVGELIFGDPESFFFSLPSDITVIGL